MSTDWYRKRPLGGILDDAARRWGRREALTFHDRRWTYAEFNAEVNRVAKGLIALGVAPGEHVTNGCDGAHRRAPLIAIGLRVQVSTSMT